MVDLQKGVCLGISPATVKLVRVQINAILRLPPPHLQQVIVSGQII